jgi:hypothetical protein
MRTVSRLLICGAIVLAAPASSQAQDSSCTPLYDAVRKAHTQPGVERTSTIGDPAKPDMVMVARKTAAGWYQRMGTAPWQPMTIDPDAAEKRMLEGNGAFSKCAAGATEAVNGSPARVWTYMVAIGPAPTPSRMWISVDGGLPVKVQAEKVLQVSTYQSTPFPKP